MIEKEFFYTISEGKILEQLLEDEHVGINHIILAKGEEIPAHETNSNVYMIIVHGVIALTLGEQDERQYSEGSLLVIPHQTLMKGRNPADVLFEAFIVKAPSPRSLS